MKEGFSFNDAAKDELHEDFRAILNAREVDPLKTIEKPPVILTVEGAPVATLGNFSLLIGRAKSKKTFLIVALISVCVNSLVETEIY